MLINRMPIFSLAQVFNAMASKMLRKNSEPPWASRILPLLMERPVAHPVEQRHSAALNHGLSFSQRGKLRERHLGGLFTWMAPRLVA